MTDKVHS